MSFDKPAAPAFLPRFYGQLYSPVFGTLYQGPEGGGVSKIPDKKPSPTTSPAETTPSGDQDSLCPFQSGQLCPCLPNPQHPDLG